MPPVSHGMTQKDKSRDGDKYFVDLQGDFDRASGINRADETSGDSGGDGYRSLFNKGKRKKSKPVGKNKDGDRDR